MALPASGGPGGGEYEALFAALERQFNQLQGEHEAVKAERDRAVAQVSTLEARCAAAVKEGEAAAARASEAAAAVHRLEATARAAQAEAEGAVARLDLKQQEIDRLAEEVRARGERLNVAQAQERDGAARVSEATALARSLQLTVERLTQERDMLAKQRAALEAELVERQAALLEARKAAASDQVELSAQVSAAHATAAAAERRANEATAAAEAARAEVAALRAAQRESEVAHARARDAWERQLAAQERLAASYHASNEDANRRVVALEAEVTSLQMALAAAKAAKETAVEAATASAAAAAEVDINAARAEAAAAKERLAAAEAQLTQLAAADAATPAGRVLSALAHDHSIGAAATHTALELLRVASEKMAAEGGGRDGDLSASVLYARVVAAEQAANTERAEAAKANAYLRQVMDQINTTAPLFAQQRQDYERVLASHEELAGRLRAALQECAKATGEVGSERQARVAAEAEAAEAKREVADLSRQVQRLLREKLLARSGAGVTSAAATLSPWGATTTSPLARMGWTRHGVGSVPTGGDGAGEGVDERGKEEDVVMATPRSGLAPLTTSEAPSGALAATSTMYGAPSLSDDQLLQLLTTASPVGGGSGAPGVAGDGAALVEEHLLTFGDVKELQLRNQQLVRVVRTLAKQLGEAGGVLGGAWATTLAKPGGGGDASAAEALRVMMAELADLRAAREKQTAMIATVVQQRDVYKLLLAQADSTLVERAGSMGMAPTTATVAAGAPVGGTAVAPGDGPTTTVPAPGLTATLSMTAPVRRGSGVTASAAAATAAAEHAATVAALEEARAELDRVRQQWREAEAANATVVDRLREEVTTLRVTAATTTADVKFYQMQAHSVREAEASARAEVQRCQARAVELQALVVKHERELAVRDAAMAAMSNEVSGLKVALANASAEKEVLAASEARHAQHLKDAMEDRDRYARMVDSLRSLESALTAREASDRQQLLDERARLQKEAATLRQSLDEERALTAQRAAAHAGELREASRRGDEALAAAAAARAELSGAKAEADGLRTHIAALHEQLSTLHGRVEGQVAALGVRGDVEATRLSAVEAQLRSTLVELAAAREMAASRERHVEESRALAAAAEEGLAAVRAAAEKWKAEAAAAVEEAKREAEVARGQVAALSESLQRERAERLMASQQWFASEDALRTEITAAKAEVKAMEVKLAAAEERVAAATADVAALEEARRATQHNYDLQLQMHAADSRALTAAQDRVKAMEDVVRSAREEASNSTAALLAREAQWAAQQTAAAAVASELTAQVADLKQQNSLLHSQLATLASAADAAQTAFLARADAAAGEGDGGGEEGGSGEVEALRKSVRELREVVAYLRRQNEVLECKAEVAENKAVGLQEAVAAARREVDAARSMHAAGGAVGATPGQRLVSVEEHDRMAATVQELNLLRESNATLRADAAAAAGRCSTAEARLRAVEAEIAPLRQASRVWQAEREALQAEVASSREDIALWRKRLDAVLAKHDAIDPTVHHALQETAAGLQAHVAKLTADLAAARAEGEAATAEVTRVKAELTAKEAEVERQTSRATTMRASVMEWQRKYRTRDEEAKAAAEAHEKAVAELTAKVAEAQSKAEAATSTPTTTAAGAPATPAGAAPITAAARRANEALVAARKQLAEANEAHKVAAEKWEGEKKELNAAIAALKDEVATQTAVATKARAEASEATGKLEVAERKVTTLQTRFTQLKALFESQKALLTTTQAKLTALEAATAVSAAAPAPMARAPSPPPPPAPTPAPAPAPEPDMPFLPLRPPSATPPEAPTAVTPAASTLATKTLPRPKATTTAPVGVPTSAPAPAPAAAPVAGAIALQPDTAAAALKARALAGRGGRAGGAAASRVGKPFVAPPPVTTATPEAPAPSPAAEAPAPVPEPVPSTPTVSETEKLARRGLRFARGASSAGAADAGTTQLASSPAPEAAQAGVKRRARPTLTTPAGVDGEGEGAGVGGGSMEALPHAEAEGRASPPLAKQPRRDAAAVSSNGEEEEGGAASALEVEAPVPTVGAVAQAHPSEEEEVEEAEEGSGEEAEEEEGVTSSGEESEAHDGDEGMHGEEEGGAISSSEEGEEGGEGEEENGSSGGEDAGHESESDDRARPHRGGGVSDVEGHGSPAASRSQSPPPSVPGGDEDGDQQEGEEGEADSHQESDDGVE